MPTKGKNQYLAIKQLFADRLGTYLIADVRVYDKIEKYEDLKYVAVILRLNKIFLDKDDDYEQIKSETVSLLLTKFPKRHLPDRLNMSIDNQEKCRQEHCHLIGEIKNKKVSTQPIHE